MTIQRILVVDDEPDLCEILRFNLEGEGFEVHCACSAEEALGLLAKGSGYSLVLLDVMMENMSGYDMARLMRQRGDTTPIIFLTALGGEQNLLEGFSSGGDDYITKPFSFPTVLARVKAVLKRTSASQIINSSTVLDGGSIVVDMQQKTVTVNGAAVALTRKEFGILALLMQGRGEHFMREAILARVWDDDTYVNERSVDVHIARLRKKLGEAGTAIVNHSGFGYTFIP